MPLLNNELPSTKITFETENNRQLLSLRVMVIRNRTNKSKFDVFSTNTHTHRYNSNSSYLSRQNKMNTSNFLVHYSTLRRSKRNTYHKGK